MTGPTDLSARLAAIDLTSLGASLDARGYAVVPGLIAHHEVLSGQRQAIGVIFHDATT